MQSLRTGRRPSHTRSPIKRTGSKLSKSPTTSRPNVRQSAVDDKIKKRMSLRYAEISAPTNASVPAVPTIPLGVRPGTTRDLDEIVLDVSQIKEDPRVADQRLLDKEDFDPDTYLRTKLASSTEAELRSLQSSLRSAKDDTAIELQKNVFKNYADFVLISKEISVLENEMLELKDSLQDWKSMPSLLQIEESASAADRRRAARSSVADLRILYASQMQTLHSSISGSAKFAPATPGRHVVSEMDGVFELNAATYKVMSVVRFVVLNDAVLVARRKRGASVAASVSGAAAGGESGGKLVTENCWPLNEMLVLDTKDTPSMTNVFKIRHGKESHVYRTEAASDKKALLGQFRQVAEELSARKRKEREGEHERRKSLWASERQSAAFNAENLPPLQDWMAELARAANSSALDTSTKGKSDDDARALSELSDDLTVAIALRDWARAVTLAESAHSHPSLAPLVAALTSALLEVLARPRNTKSVCVELIGHLLRLGAGAKAQETFLAARGEAIRKYIRAIPYEGHVGLYVHDLAMVVFTALKHTADWFLAGFVEHEMTSSFINWTKGQIEIFAEIFRRQVYNSDIDKQAIDEALKIIYSQSKKLLQEFGLDFRYLLDDLLVEDSKHTLTSTSPTSSPHTIVPPSTLRSRTPQPAQPAAPVPIPTSSTTLAPVVPPRARTPVDSRESESASSRLAPSHDPKATFPPPRSTHRPGSLRSLRVPREGMF